MNFRIDSLDWNDANQEHFSTKGSVISVFILFLFVLLSSCKKSVDTVVLPPPPTEPHPQMIYKNLKDAEVQYLQTKTVDVTNDGAADFVFGVRLLGDPVLQRDRRQFVVNSGVQRNLLNNAADQSPVLNKLDTIGKRHEDYQWWQISSVVLAEKIITYSGTYWDGLWTNANHNYLPIQVEKNGRLFHGWIELSFSTTGEKLILHRAAISAEEEKTVKAGY
jgi:hypothetical protein